jgi:hypothetical protein
MKKDDWSWLLVPVAILGAYAFTQQQQIDPKILEFTKRIKVKIYGRTTYERTVDFTSRYVKLFHAQKGGGTGINSMCLIGVEDIDEGVEPDGWTDVLLPIFYSVAPNQGGVNYPIIFIDAAFSGAYAKELYIFSRGNWHRVFYYSPATGLRVYGPDGPMGSVGYIEYDPEVDMIYSPSGIL